MARFGRKDGLEIINNAGAKKGGGESGSQIAYDNRMRYSVSACPLKRWTRSWIVNHALLSFNLRFSVQSAAAAVATTTEEQMRDQSVFLILKTGKRPVFTA
jgi:hypothetical protein